MPSWSKPSLLIVLGVLVSFALIQSAISIETEEEVDTDNHKGCDATNSKNDGSCVWHNSNDDDYSFYNPQLHAYNLLEVDVPVDVVKDLFQGYRRDVAPHYDTHRSTHDFCLVTPYAPGVQTWGSLVDDNEVRSDIRWYSVNNPATYDKYQQQVERLGLLERVREHRLVPETEDLTVLSIFFIPRSFSKKFQFHEDWPEEVGSQVVTFLVPLSDDFSIHMVYKDEDDEIRHYNYTMGKAIGVGGGLLHSTGVGHAETQNVLLCVYIGGRNEEMWEHALDTISDELEHYYDPFQGFIRNKNLKGGKSKCQ
jgi:hypothetical protein